MNLVEDCLNKVKKDCYKFIKTQETSSDKFKNKDKMLKHYLVPMSSVSYTHLTLPTTPRV